MRFRGKLLSALTLSDLEALIMSRVPESQMLDYKLGLPGSRDEDKREFLADVSSFANTAGGALLYGIETERDEAGNDTGVPGRITGISSNNLDKERLRLTSMLHDGVTPSLANQAQFAEISVDRDRAVILLAVAKSIASPHMVAFQHSGKFWRRSTAGKYQPDVVELRRMFLESESWVEEAEKLRARRLQALKSMPRVAPLAERPYALLHVLPLGRQSEVLDLKPHQGTLNSKMPPLKHEGWNYRWNADGFQTFLADTSNIILSYSQCLRFGGIEGFSALISSDRGTEPGKPPRLLFAASLFPDTVNYVGNAVGLLSTELERDPPFVALLSLCTLKGSRIPTHAGLVSGIIESDQLLLPPVLLDGEEDIKARLTGWFDILWQAAGSSGVPSIGGYEVSA